jgi:hypothetical protein
MIEDEKAQRIGRNQAFKKKQLDLSGLNEDEKMACEMGYRVALNQVGLNSINSWSLRRCDGCKTFKNADEMIEDEEYHVKCKECASKVLEVEKYK